MLVMAREAGGLRGSRGAHVSTELRAAAPGRVAVVRVGRRGAMSRAALHGPHMVLGQQQGVRLSGLPWRAAARVMDAGGGRGIAKSSSSRKQVWRVCDVNV